MIYSYKECIEKYRTDYRLKMIVAEGRLFQIEKGIYADTDRVAELDLITYKYPNAIFTLESAYYYHGVTDVIPEKYVLNTGRNAPKIRDKRVKQRFCSDKLLNIGKIQMDYQGISISIYNLERLAIELIRHQGKLPYDYYKEIIHSFRERAYAFDIEKMQEYILQFPANKKIRSIIEKEIF